jgi:hypothetical protein
MLDVAAIRAMPDGVDLNKVESIQVSLSSLEICDKKVRPYIVVPTCSCDYIKFLAKRNKVECRDLGLELKPTRIDKNGQCVYCGYYSCWKRIFLKNIDSVPIWAKPEWYTAPDETDWFSEVYRKEQNQNIVDRSGVETSIVSIPTQLN